jgi:hypothetical protein
MEGGRKDRSELGLGLGLWLGIVLGIKGQCEWC